MRINKHDTNGTKPLLGKGELGYDDYTAGGDTGRVYVGNGASNIALAKKSEVDAKVVANAGITAGTATKVTYDEKGLVTSGTTLSAGDIPVLDAGKITTGTLPVAIGGTGTTASTGTGDVVLSNSPALVTPNIGIATGTSFNSITGLASVNPIIAGVAAVGTSTLTARQDHVHPVQTSVSGNAGTATKLATARTITLTGGVTGSVNFDGSGNVSITTIVADDSHNHIISNVDGLQAALDLKANQATTYTKEETESYVQQKLSDGGRDVYLGSYGLTWNETTGVYTRIGAENYTAIQSKMKRCVLNADGSVNYYLSATDSNYKADGTAADLTGASGNVMVEIPKFYIRYGYTTTGGGGSDTVHSWEISQTPDTGFAEHWAFTRGVSVAKRYYPAYQGYSTGSKLISRSGVYPTVSQTLGQFRTLSKANSITNPSTGQTVNGYWSNIDFALYEAITLLMIIEYGTMDIQSALGKGRTMLSGGSWVGSELIGATGLSNAFGNRTANYTYTGLSTDASADLSFMSYRGCENFFGNVWRMADGVIFLGTTNNKSMWFSTNPSTFNDTASGYTQVAGVSTASSSGYGRKLASTDKGFIITDVAGGTSGNGTTDYYYTSTTDATVALVGGDSGSGRNAGPLSLSVYAAAASAAAVSVGCGVSF